MTEDDNILEYGIASISIQNKSVDFSNSFVPLLKIGAHVKIVCTANGQQTHSFSGEVFLSSQNLLRIVSIKCKLLPYAENVLSINTSINGKVLHSHIKSKRHSGNIPCIISSLSALKLSFKSEQLEIDWHTPFYISISEPVFTKETKIAVKATKNSLVFGENAKYDCDIASISRSAVKELIEFIRNENIQLLKDILI